MNLLRCLTCKKILTSEEVKDHNVCNVTAKNWKTINVSYLTTLKNDEGENCAMFTGLDGTNYRVIEKRPNLVEYHPDLNANQPTGNRENNYRGGNSTLKQYSYKVQVPYNTV